VADQAPLHRRPARQRRHVLLGEPEQDRARPPPRMLTAQLHDPGLDARRHLMRTRQRLRRLVGQPGQPAGRVPAQPTVDRLTGHPIAAGDVGHGGSVVEDLQHCLIALLHQSQLHEHGRPPSDLWANNPQRRRWRPAGGGPSPEAAVSCRYRGHCRPGTGVASWKCPAGTGATVSTMNRVRTPPDLRSRQGHASLRSPIPGLIRADESS
jgi:hypothetical protein